MIRGKFANAAKRHTLLGDVAPAAIGPIFDNVGFDAAGQNLNTEALQFGVIVAVRFGGRLQAINVALGQFLRCHADFPCRHRVATPG